MASPGELMATAAERTGLCDFGDDSFREGLEILVTALRDEARLNERGQGFLYARMYRSPPILAIQAEAKKILAGLFAAYRDAPELLPPAWRIEEDDSVARLRHIGDFVAGMTDRYAVARYRELVGEPAIPELV